MQIHSLQATQASQALGGTARAQRPPSVESTTALRAPANDQVEFSAEAEALMQFQAVDGTANDFRADKVNSIRQAIADGTYETPEKLDLALDRLLDSFA
ncbi:MAG: flagellar biosynthesis anti-sigma factor FlgM [Planctomycetales bacterium]|nr:flagellar biosynthesis anti-sigma factor FlgM [Planctomycetales bacterium]